MRLDAELSNNFGQIYWPANKIQAVDSFSFLARMSAINYEKSDMLLLLLRGLLSFDFLYERVNLVFYFICGVVSRLDYFDYVDDFLFFDQFEELQPLVHVVIGFGQGVQRL